MPFWISIIIVVAIVSLAFWGKFNMMEKEGTSFIPRNSIDTFEECAKYYPVMESYPEQCSTPDGGHFVNPTQVVTGVGEMETERVAAGYIAGTVNIGPNCPVEREGVPCETPEEAYTSREVLVYESDGKNIHERIRILAGGTYWIAVGPGNYFVQISPAGIGPGEMKEVTVKSFETSIVDFDIDTGIR